MSNPNALLTSWFKGFFSLDLDEQFKRSILSTHFHAIRRHGAWWVKYTASWRHGEGCSHCILQISPVSLRQRFGPCLTGCGTSGLWEAAGGSSASTQQGAFRRIFDFALHQHVETISIGAKSITDIEQWWLIWKFEQGFCECFAGINTSKYITWSFWNHQSEVSRHYQGAFHKVTTAQFWLESILKTQPDSLGNAVGMAILRRTWSADGIFGGWTFHAQRCEWKLTASQRRKKQISCAYFCLEA